MEATGSRAGRGGLEDLLVEGHTGFGGGFGAQGGAGAMPGLFGEGAAKDGVFAEFPYRTGQVGGVVVLEDDARVAGDFARAGAAGDDHGTAGGEAFATHVRVAFAEAGDDDERALGQLVGDLGAGHFAEEGDAAGEFGGDVLAHPVGHGAAAGGSESVGAGDAEMGGGVCTEEGVGGLSQ